MKQLVTVTLAASVFMFGFTSCNDNEKKEANNEAQEVAEASNMATSYMVDASASEITWKGSKPTGTHNGTIEVAKGEVFVNDGELEAGNFVIDMSSIVVLDLEGKSKQNLESHLKGTVEGKEGDFFNINKYPTANFELTGVEMVNGTSMINGNLTIKEKTNNISFPAMIKMQGDQLMIQSETFTLDRTKWDVNYGSKSIFDNLGDSFVDDEMVITINLTATK
ncbi:MAG: YceI family protein [Flavobacteriaceae bacterium]|nr:YceI family protein [Flavobacteriaceae bacterium]